jgi:hypothetical protein
MKNCFIIKILLIVLNFQGYMYSNNESNINNYSLLKKIKLIDVKLLNGYDTNNLQLLELQKEKQSLIVQLKEYLTKNRDKIIEYIEYQINYQKSLYKIIDKKNDKLWNFINYSDSMMSLIDEINNVNIDYNLLVNIFKIKTYDIILLNLSKLDSQLLTYINNCNQMEFESIYSKKLESMENIKKYLTKNCNIISIYIDYQEIYNNQLYKIINHKNLKLSKYNIPII